MPVIAHPHNNPAGLVFFSLFSRGKLSLQKIDILQKSQDKNPSQPGSKTSPTLRGFIEEVGFEFTLKDEQDFYKRKKGEGEVGVQVRHPSPAK